MFGMTTVSVAVLTGLCCASALGATLTVGQVSPLSGPAATIGVPLAQATRAYFNKVNQTGGVNGHKLSLAVRDDAFNPDQTIAHATELSKDAEVVALVNVVGAPNTGNLTSTGLLNRTGLSVVGAFTGATSVRAQRNPSVYFIRPSVAAEAQSMARQLNAMGIQRIGMVRANDAFGADAQAQLESLAKARGLHLLRVSTYEPATVDAMRAGADMMAAAPQAIAFFGTGPAAAKFIGSYRGAGGRALILLSSATSADVLVAQAGKELSRGIGLVQAMPPATKTELPLVKEYVETLAAYGEKDAKPSTAGLEGFVAAKILVEAIRRCGANPTRDAVTRSLSNVGRVNFGGFVLDYSEGRREGQTVVQIGIIGPGGRLLN